MTIEFVDIEPGDRRLVTDVFPVLVELRSHLTDGTLVEVYEHGHPQGLRYLAAYEDGSCVGVAGWRIVDTTATIRKVYVDDLVTTSTRRSGGIGAALLAEIERRGRAAGCRVLELDSGIHRPDAHRFYFRQRLAIRSFHFAKEI